MKAKGKTYSTEIDRRRQVRLPPGLIDWRPGQRVYWHVRADKSLVISPMPKGLYQGRFISSRVRVCRVKRPKVNHVRR